MPERPKPSPDPMYGGVKFAYITSPYAGDNTSLGLSIVDRIRQFIGQDTSASEACCLAIGKINPWIEGEKGQPIYNPHGKVFVAKVVKFPMLAVKVIDEIAALAKQWQFSTIWSDRDTEQWLKTANLWNTHCSIQGYSISLYGIDRDKDPVKRSIELIPAMEQDKIVLIKDAAQDDLLSDALRKPGQTIESDAVAGLLAVTTKYV